jgi:hypothetical protein
LTRLENGTTLHGKGSTGMADRMTVPFTEPDGTITKAIGILVKVVKADVQQSEYILEDGTKLHISQTVVHAVKLDGKTDNGDPIYAVLAQQTLSVIPQIKE